MCQAHSWSAARWWSGDSSFAIGIAQAALYYYCIHKQWLHSSVSGSGAARLAATCTCAVHCACSWLTTVTTLLWHIYSLVYPTLSEETIKYGTKGEMFLSDVRWVLTEISRFIDLWNGLFLSFLLTTVGIMVFIGCVDVINLWWLIRCYSFDSFYFILLKSPSVRNGGYEVRNECY